MKSVVLLFAIATVCFLTIYSCKNKGKVNLQKSDIELPTRGLCAHRGASETHPENTLAAFLEAVKAGAHMIEFDVSLSKDSEMVIIHDSTVDRTTNGTGKVSDLTLEKIKKLDAGSWKSPAFEGEKVPTLKEVLGIMPLNIWLNIHVKGEDLLPVLVAETLAEQKRLHQAFLACSASAAARAKNKVPEIMICNMDRKESDLDYVKETINMKADFIQLRQQINPTLADYINKLSEKGIRVNYYGTDSPDDVRKLFTYGVNFPLVNDIVSFMNVAAEYNILPIIPVY
jgi:glycerophosphoryl diester phosphodiesterase